MYIFKSKRSCICPCHFPTSPSFKKVASWLRSEVKSLYIYQLTNFTISFYKSSSSNISSFYKSQC